MTDKEDTEAFTPCCVAHVDGSSCGLEMGHQKLHEFTVPPPDEYFEDVDTCPICSEGNEWCECNDTYVATL